MSFLTETNSLIDKVKHDLDSSETRIINNMEWSERIGKGECYVREQFNALLMMIKKTNYYYQFYYWEHFVALISYWQSDY